MTESNYILLIRRADFIDFFKNGKMNGNLCSNEKFDGNISKLSADRTIAFKVFRKANHFDYSIDYLLMHVRCQTLGKLLVSDIEGLYALDDEAYGIGIEMNPPIVLHPALWQSFYYDYQIECNICSAEEGVDFLAEILGWNKFSPKCKLKKNDLVEVYRQLYFEERPSGNLPIWSYLLRYERHETYPNDSRGFVLDALHVYGNYLKKTEIYSSVLGTPMGKVVAAQEPNTRMNDIINHVFTKEFFKKMKKNKVDISFMKVASLFLYLKSIFANGVSDEKLYHNHSFEEYINILKDKNNEDILMSAIYLLGLSLGREGIYKYMYKKEGYNFLKR